LGITKKKKKKVTKKKKGERRGGGSFELHNTLSVCWALTTFNTPYGSTTT